MSRFSQIIRRRLYVVAAALVVGAGWSVGLAAPPAVLKDVPADAYAVVVVNNARALANKVSNAATRLNLPIPPDLIGWATRSIGITDGFDANGSAALVLLKPSDERLQEGYFSSPPPMVLLIPTTDSKAMLAPFKPGDPDKDGISEVTLPADPDQKGFVATVEGKWVVLAQKKEDMASYLARKQSFADSATPETLKVFDTNDLVIWGNVEKLAAGSDKAIDDAQTELSGMMDLAAVTAKQDVILTALQKEMISGMFSFAKEYVTDAKAAMITARLTDSGATLGMEAEFKPDSMLGKFVASQGALAASGRGASLKGLPGGNFIVAGGAVLNTDLLAGPVNDFTDRLLADPAVVKDERAAKLKSMIDLAKQEIAITQGMHAVLLDPAAGGQNGLLNGAFIVDTSDPQKYMDLQVQSLKFSDLFEQVNPDITQTTSFAADAITIKGVHLNRITVKVALRQETPDNPLQPESKQTMQILGKVYGPDGMTFYSGVVGKHVIMIYGSDNVTLESSVAAAQADSDELSTNPMIVGVKDQVVSNALGVAYLPITRWIVLAQSIIAPPAAGQPAPGASITGAPPVVTSAGVNGTILTLEMHLPIATIIGIRDASQQLQGAVERGGAPVPPNLLP